MADQQWSRKFTLIVAAGSEGLDLSGFRCRFSVKQSDFETPNSATIRVYNPSDATVRKITGQKPVEFTRVVLQAGYENGAFGVIFDGTIIQFRKGKENATDSYLDILANEADLPYNFGMCAATVAAGSTAEQRVGIIAQQSGFALGDISGIKTTGGTLPRGKVMFGMARSQLRCEAITRGASWSVQDGAVQITPLDGYLPGEAVVLNSLTGLIGRAEQTEDGVKFRALINPKMRVGGLVQIDQASINQMSQADLRAMGFATPRLEQGQIAFDRPYSTPQMLADVTADGFYRLYVAEYIGDTRGQDWYIDGIGLAVDKSSNKVLAQ